MPRRMRGLEAYRAGRGALRMERAALGDGLAIEGAREHANANLTARLKVASGMLRPDAWTGRLPSTKTKTKCM